ncbi:hypothetical protein D9M70_609950 [compost metagenome]
MADAVLVEQGIDLGVAHRPVAVVELQVLLGNVGDILAVVVFGEQMVEGLILARADLLRNGVPPFFGVGVFRIDVENDASERENPMANHLSDLEFGVSLFHDATHPFRRLSGLANPKHQ